MASNYESLDTCVLVRLVIGDNQHQSNKFYNLLVNSPDTNFYVDDLAITEMVYVLSTVYHLNRIEIAKSIEQIFKPAQIVGNYTLFAEILPFYVTHPKLSFNDCYLSFKAAAKHAEPLWTFDQKFANQSPTAKELR